MAYLIFGGFVVVVLVLSVVSLRSGRPVHGCCAPADPQADVRMRGASPATEDS